MDLVDLKTIRNGKTFPNATEVKKKTKIQKLLIFDKPSKQTKKSKSNLRCKEPYFACQPIYNIYQKDNVAKTCRT